MSQLNLLKRIELLSDSTAKTDDLRSVEDHRGFKKTPYANVFRTPDYFWFDPASYEFKGFHLLDGQYEELQPNELGHLWSQQLNLFLGIHEQTLRFFTEDGVLVPTPEESAEVAIVSRARFVGTGAGCGYRFRRR